jgi:CRISPR/Cas system-associated protein Cas7 (RAMP superfamily)
LAAAGVAVTNEKNADTALPHISLHIQIDTIVSNDTSRLVEGMTYYFVPHIVGEAVYAIDAKFDLSQVDPNEGKVLVAKAKLRTSHPK